MVSARDRIPGWSLFITVLLLVGVSTIWIEPVAAQGTFTGSGVIIGSNPAGKMFFTVTEQEFLERCVHPPVTQGVDAVIFDVPPTLVGEPAMATGTSAGPYDLDLDFFDKDCALISGSYLASPNETSPVVGGTEYVAVFAASGANTTACLRIGASAKPCGAGSPSGSPTQTPTATPTSTSTQSPTATPTPTSSPTSSPGEASTTIASSRRIAKYKKPFKLTGTVKTKGSSCRHPYFITVKKTVLGKKRSSTVSSSIPTDKAGKWKFSHKSTVSAAYTATPRDATGCKSVESSPVVVKVRAKIVFKVPTPCRAPQKIKGKVLPNHKGSKIRLQRKAGKWRNIDTDKLNKKSRFSLTADTCSGSFRVLWPPKGKKNARGSKNFKF